MIAAGFDTETTGLTFDEHRFVEVAVQLWNVETETLIESYVQRINPGRSILLESTRVHGITLSDVLHSPSWEDVAPKVVALLNRADLLVAHNGKEFDYPFLNSELMRIGLPIIDLPLVDTMNARWATAQGKLPTLGELCFACGVEYDAGKAHAADYDVEVMVRAYLKARQWGYFKSEGVTP